MIEPELVENNRKRCSFCDKSIEKGTYYLSTDYSSRFGKSNKSICINCMIRGVIQNFIISNVNERINELKKQIDLLTKKEVIKELK